MAEFRQFSRGMNANFEDLKETISNMGTERPVRRRQDRHPQNAPNFQAYVGDNYCIEAIRRISEQRDPQTGVRRNNRYQLNFVQREIERLESILLHAGTIRGGAAFLTALQANVLDRINEHENQATPEQVRSRRLLNQRIETLLRHLR